MKPDEQRRLLHSIAMAPARKRWPRVLELSPSAYAEIRDALLGAGYDGCEPIQGLFPDFGSFRLPDEDWIIRNRERSKL